MRQTTNDLPTVLILATGGTIGMHDRGNGFEIDPDFPEILEERANEIAARYGFRARVNQLQPAIESSNADEETAPKIARAIRARVTAMRPIGAVVTHGTDTLAYSASRLAFELADLGVPVAITGSQFAHGVDPTDAWDNLELAIRTVAQGSSAATIAPANVSVAFGGQVMPGQRATKFDAEGLVAFRAERALGTSPRGIPAPAAGADAGRRTHARVLSFRFTPAVAARDLLAAASGEPDALVLECYGAGNAPMGKPGMADALREIAARMPVAVITQCTHGEMDTSRYAVGRQLAATGVIPGGELTVEAAIAKLGYLLDRGYSREEIAALVPANLVGECSGTAD